MDLNLVGIWQSVKSNLNSLPVGATIQFAKDGKVKTTRKAAGKDETLEGTFTVAGDKITLTRKVGNDQLASTLTIKKATATELTLERDGKSAELKRKK